MNLPELFWISGSPPAWRVMLALEIKGIDYVSRRIEDAKSLDFLQLNPRGQVPVLRLDDLVVRESLAIIAYLDRLQPIPPLLGTDPISTAAIWQWLMDFEFNFRPKLAMIAQAIFRDLVEIQVDEIAAASEIVVVEIKNINHCLAQQQYICEGSLSATDITLYPSLQWLRRALTKTSVPATQQLANILANTPHLLRWESMIANLPGYHRTYPPHWRSN